MTCTHCEVATETKEAIWDIIISCSVVLVLFRTFFDTHLEPFSLAGKSLADHHEIFVSTNSNRSSSKMILSTWKIYILSIFVPIISSKIIALRSVAQFESDLLKTSLFAVRKVYEQHIKLAYRANLGVAFDFDRDKFSYFTSKAHLSPPQTFL